MNPSTTYNLEKYLKDRKKEEADKPAREPSGFMKRPSHQKQSTDNKLTPRES